MNQVVAYTPHELAIAQGTVRGWCAENIRRLLSSRKEAEQNVAQARAGKFNSKPFQSLVNRCDQRIEFYKKIGRAIKAGYMIVPNFTLNLFAVRTNKKTPRGAATASSWRAFPQEGDSLPIGEGRYVDDIPFEESDTETVVENGKEKTVTTRWPSRFDEEITFPAQFVKPQLITETQRAMSLKVFDQIGVATGTYLSPRSDPIIRGRVIDRTRRGKAVTFFIAWWFDRDAL